MSNQKDKKIGLILTYLGVSQFSPVFSVASYRSESQRAIVEATRSWMGSAEQGANRQSNQAPDHQGYQASIADVTRSWMGSAEQGVNRQSNQAPSHQASIAEATRSWMGSVEQGANRQGNQASGAVLDGNTDSDLKLRIFFREWDTLASVEGGEAPRELPSRLVRGGSVAEEAAQLARLTGEFGEIGANIADNIAEGSKVALGIFRNPSARIAIDSLRNLALFLQVFGTTKFPLETYPPEYRQLALRVLGFNIALADSDIASALFLDYDEYYKARYVEIFGFLPEDKDRLKTEIGEIAKQLKRVEEELKSVDRTCADFLLRKKELLKRSYEESFTEMSTVLNATMQGPELASALKDLREGKNARIEEINAMELNREIEAKKQELIESQEYFKTQIQDKAKQLQEVFRRMETHMQRSMQQRLDADKAQEENSKTRRAQVAANEYLLDLNKKKIEHEKAETDSLTSIRASVEESFRRLTTGQIAQIVADVAISNGMARAVVGATLPRASEHPARSDGGSEADGEDHGLLRQMEGLQGQQGEVHRQLNALQRQQEEVGREMRTIIAQAAQTAQAVQAVQAVQAQAVAAGVAGAGGGAQAVQAAQQAAQAAQAVQAQAVAAGVAGAGGGAGGAS